MTATIQQHPIDVGHEYNDMVEMAPGAAVATFTGYVREWSSDQAITVLELEHYPEMASKTLDIIGSRAAKEFNLKKWRIVHRFGRLRVLETIVWVGSIAEHRGDAISGCDFIMDVLKTDAPFWKREHGPNGTRWVTNRNIDQQRRSRWETRRNT